MMKWYETINPYKKVTTWWTQRDDLGICYEVKRFHGEQKLHLLICDIEVSTHATLIEAMKAAEAHFNSNHK